jgi:signal transduction histidine kinase
MKSFTQRLTLRFAALVTTTTALVLGIGGWLLDREAHRGIEALHAVEFKELRALIGDSPALTADEIARRIGRDAESDAALYFLQVHSERGEVMFRSLNLGANVLPDLSGRDQHWTFELPGIGPVHISEFNEGPWHVQVASPMAPMRRLMRDYMELAAILVAVVAAVSVGLGYGFSRLTLRPMRAIEQTARRIRGDTLGERIPVPPGQDELSALVRLLNQMFDRLEASFDQVRRFTADASHELKTPLALVRLNAEKLRSRLTHDAEGLTTLEDLLEEISQLHQIIESLLFLSRAESGALAPKIRVVEVAAFVRDFAEDAGALAQDRGVTFKVGAMDPGELSVEPVLLRQLLLNLVSNALVVTPRGGTITLEVIESESGYRFELADEGPGLPDEQLERIFERFVRFEPPSGAQGPRGHGLGLAICRTIARMHGGTIRAQNRTDRTGLKVVVELPRAVRGVAQAGSPPETKV